MTWRVDILYVDGDRREMSHRDFDAFKEAARYHDAVALMEADERFHAGICKTECDYYTRVMSKPYEVTI